MKTCRVNVIYIKYFKSEFKIENYFIQLNKGKSIMLYKFRMNNIKLPIVTGRFTNVSRERRIYNICNLGKMRMNIIHFFNVIIQQFK